MERAAAADEIEALGFRDLIRHAAREQPIDHPGQWFEHCTARNKTSHAYQESFAMDTYHIAPRSLRDAQELLNRLARTGYRVRAL